MYRSANNLPGKFLKILGIDIKTGYEFGATFFDIPVARQDGLLQVVV